MSSRTPEVSRSCWSCRLLSGGALLCSAGFVYRSARTGLHRGARAPVGTALQLAFAAERSNKMATSVSGVPVTLSKFVWNKSRLIHAIRGISAASACLRTHSSSDKGGSSITESTEEFSFVERLIPPTRIPTPPKHTGPTPSGWTSPSEMPPSLPYMIRRSRMHNIPVYSDIKHGNQKSTIVRKVEGDIWALNKDVKEHLQQLTGREPPTKVNEVTMSIRVKGQFDTELKEWLLKLGF